MTLSRALSLSYLLAVLSVAQLTAAKPKPAAAPATPVAPAAPAAASLTSPGTTQTKPVAPAAPAAVTPKALEFATVACINSGAFLAQEDGIKVLVRAAQGIDLEFSSTQSGLSLLSEKLRTLVGELQKLSVDQVANAKAIQEKQMEGQKLQQELEQKQQQAQAAYQQRQQETFGPLMQKVGVDLQAYAKERNLSLLIDLSKLADGVLYLKPELDVTADFIARYNAKNQ